MAQKTESRKNPKLRRKPSWPKILSRSLPSGNTQWRIDVQIDSNRVYESFKAEPDAITRAWEIFHDRQKAGKAGFELPMPKQITPCIKKAGPIVQVKGLRNKLHEHQAAAGLSRWPQNAMRHSFGSYALSAWQDVPRVSYQMGNSPQICKRHYEQIVTKSAAGAFWALRPTQPHPEHQHRASTGKNESWG